MSNVPDADRKAVYQQDLSLPVRSGRRIFENADGTQTIAAPAATGPFQGDLSLVQHSGSRISENDPDNAKPDGSAPYRISSLTVTGSTEGNYNQDYAWDPTLKRWVGVTTSSIYFEPSAVGGWQINDGTNVQYIQTTPSYNPIQHYDADGTVVDADGIDVTETV